MVDDMSNQRQPVRLLEKALEKRLFSRSQAGLLRTLAPREPSSIDFCSNDYLGLSVAPELAHSVKGELERNKYSSGSTGSRLISGNHPRFEELEGFLSRFHNDNQEDCALLFNSGYDANLGFFSSVPTRGDIVLYDEYSHASIRDGLRLSFARSYSFRHNDPHHLENRLRALRSQNAGASILVATESLFSMDGDFAPLQELQALCEQFGAALIVDEAHATGVFGPEGRGLVHAAQLQNKVWARIHTFGKALGCHGAVIVGPPVLRSYLINFARSFIYSTALSPHTLVAIRAAYDSMRESHAERQRLEQVWKEFNKIVAQADLTNLRSPELQLRSGPIQSIIIPGNQKVTALARHLSESGINVVAIRSPTVPQGKERLRISLHAFNTREQIERLFRILEEVKL